MAGILFIISAPSGSGKSTLVQQLRSYVRDLEFSISYTTRAPRGSEQEGREYHYTDRETFERMQGDGEFLESADVYGNMYGTARKSLVDAAAHGHDLLLDIDVQGAAQVRKALPDAVSVFVLPPNPEELAKRLRKRSRAEGNISEEEIERRLAKAKHEIENYDDYGYILVNDNLERAVEELEGIVASERVRRGHPVEAADVDRLLTLAENCRRGHATERLAPVLASFGISEHVRTR